MKKLEAEVRLKDRMAAVGELSAGIAHEIRNPLAAIAGSVQVLKSSQVADAAGAAADVDRAEGIGAAEQVDLRLPPLRAPAGEARRSSSTSPASLSETLDLLANSPELHERHEIRREIAPPSFQLVGDADQIRQVFWNLARNAVQAMPQGGVLTVRTIVDDGSYHIIFADSGRGMSHADLQRLFQPFRTNFPSGTGLGMAISYRIVQEHGGKIDVTSSEGRRARPSPSRCRSLQRLGDARDKLATSDRRSHPRPHAGPGRPSDRALPPPEAAARVHRPAQGQGEPRDLADGGAQAQRAARSRAALRPSRPRQDHAREHRRQRDGRQPAHDLRPGAGEAGRPRGHRHEPRGRRRAVHRRDPSPAADRRGSPLLGDGGLSRRRRDRTGSGRAHAEGRAAALHARRRDHARGPAHRAAARALRHRAPPRLLRRRFAHRSSSAAPPTSSASRSITTAASRSPAARAARRASPTACCAACATSPRCGTREASTWPSRARRCACSKSTSTASTRSTASC